MGSQTVATSDKIDGTVLKIAGVIVLGAIITVLFTAAIRHRRGA